MITFQSVSLRRGTRLLFENINWTIYPKERIGLVGANGAGKTSLFAVLLNELPIDKGDMYVQRDLRFAHIAQETPALNQTALEFTLGGDEEYIKIQQALNEALNNDDGLKIAALHEQLSIIDGYTAPARAGQLLFGLGFTAEEHEKEVKSFSGGWRVRLNLARALMCRSDILLLDEPTNHLDLDAVLWLEQWLAKYNGTLILISHDRDFLDKTVSRIAHIANQSLEIYSGNYSSYEKQRAEKLMLQQAAFEKQQKQISHMQSFVDRFRAKASKARQAQSRMKAIERLDLVCAVQTESPFNFHFKKPSQCPNPLIYLDHVKAGYGDHIVLSNLNFSIAPKDRIAILGPNGAGKSTFIKLLAKELEPLSGKCESSSAIKVGYFAQHQVDHLSLTESALDQLRDIASNEPELNLRKFLGSFGFSGDKVTTPVATFSGGEKSRLALALIVWQKPNILLLDEPTNHLDLDMRNALSIALQEYEGAMVLVSHDRFLVRTTTDALLLIADGKLQDFSGDMQDYQQWLLEYRADIKKTKSSVSPSKSIRSREPKGSSDSNITKLEKQCHQIGKKLTEIEKMLADNSLYNESSKIQLKQALQDQANLKLELEQAEQAWLSACEKSDDV